jgi:aminoglycoside 2'-N-acetyltransferase I
MLVRVAATAELTGPELDELHALMVDAFGDRVTAQDWQNTLGGRHVIVRAEAAGEVVAHAALIKRALVVAGRTLRTGYVEGVATRPDQGGRGHATAAMRVVNDIISAEFDIGGLSTGAQHFYERLGWERWCGPTYVDSPSGRVPTPEDDDGVMVLRASRSPTVDFTAPIVCDWRLGDVW